MGARKLMLLTAECCGVLVLVVAVLPLVAIAGWLARGLAVVLALASLAGLLLLTWLKPDLRRRIGQAIGVIPMPPGQVHTEVRRR